MAREPLLNLSTLVEDRPVIRINGDIYHLKSSEELSLLDSQRFTAWGQELEELGKAAGQTDALTELVGVVAWAALADVPRDVFDGLSSTQQMAIVEVFTGLLLGRRLRLAAALVEQVVSRPTGENSSPGSNTSSAAMSTDGSAESQPLS